MSITSTLYRSLAGTLLVASAAGQTTWYVDVNGVAPGNGSGANPYTSIGYAIDAATTLSGDTLLVAPGTYVENVSYGIKNLRVASTHGAKLTIIDGNQAGPCVEFPAAQNATTALEGFTLTNGAAGIGGGVRSLYGSPEIRSCVITSNTAISRGAGLWIGYGSPLIARCVITGNTVTGANGEGGGLYATYGFSMRIENCTFSQNSAPIAAGIKAEFDNGAKLVNTILWGDAGGELVTYQSQLAVSYSDVQGGATGVGNLSGDPLFANPAAGDWRLLPGSPCIDAGDPASPPDPDGSRADIGAIPSGGPAVAYCTAKTNSLGCVPAIGWTGTPSASMAAGFLVRGANVRNRKNGLLFYGTTGRSALPFQGGILCVKSPLRRTPAVNSGGTPAPANDCSGVFAIDMNAFSAGALGGNPPATLTVPGTVVDAQWWGRDPGFPAPSNTTLSDGLEYTVGV